MRKICIQIQPRRFCLSASISIIIYFPANGKRRKIVIFAYEMDFLCVLFIRCTSDDYAYLYGVWVRVRISFELIVIRIGLLAYSAFVAAQSASVNWSEFLWSLQSTTHKYRTETDHMHKYCNIEMDWVEYQ